MRRETNACSMQAPLDQAIVGAVPVASGAKPDPGPTAEGCGPLWHHVLLTELGAAIFGAADVEGPLPSNKMVA